jgi:hypothetical protein
MIPSLEEMRQDALTFIGWTEPPPSQLLVVTGANAAGKSLCRRMYSLACKKEGSAMEFIGVSIEFQTQGFMAMSFVFGDESCEATGINRAHTLISGFDTSHSRGKPHLIVYDEPEIGMSEELQHTSVDYLISQFQNWPEFLEGMVFFTHSRIFAGRLVQEQGAQFVNLKNEFPTIEEWLARDVRRDTRPLNEITQEANDRYRAFVDILKPTKS